MRATPPHPRRVFMQQRPASGRRQAPRNGALILESARELGIRDAQVGDPMLHQSGNEPLGVQPCQSELLGSRRGSD